MADKDAGTEVYAALPISDCDTGNIYDGIRSGIGNKQYARPIVAINNRRIRPAPYNKQAVVNLEPTLG